MPSWMLWLLGSNIEQSLAFFIARLIIYLPVVIGLAGLVQVSRALSYGTPAIYPHIMILY